MRMLWSRRSLGEPARVGFNNWYKGQERCITILVPLQHYRQYDSNITIKPSAEVTSSTPGESAGWDNRKIYELGNYCSCLNEIDSESKDGERTIHS